MTTHDPIAELIEAVDAWSRASAPGGVFTASDNELFRTVEAAEAAGYPARRADELEAIEVLVRLLDAIVILRRRGKPALAQQRYTDAVIAARAVLARLGRM